MDPKPTEDAAEEGPQPMRAQHEEKGELPALAPLAPVLATDAVTTRQNPCSGAVAVQPSAFTNEAAGNAVPKLGDALPAADVDMPTAAEAGGSPVPATPVAEAAEDGSTSNGSKKRSAPAEAVTTQENPCFGAVAVQASTSANEAAGNAVPKLGGEAPADALPAADVEMPTAAEAGRSPVPATPVAEAAEDGSTNKGSKKRSAPAESQPEE